MRIELPAELRASITEYQAQIAAEVVAHAERATKLAAVLESLREQLTGLEAEQRRTQAAATADDAAAIETLQRLETSLTVARRQVEQAEQDLEQHADSQVKLDAGDLLLDLATHYSEALPPLIEAALRPLFCEDHALRIAVANTQAMTTLQKLRDHARWKANAEVNEFNLRQVNEILERSLAGKPALWFDALEERAESTEGLTESPAAAAEPVSA